MRTYLDILKKVGAVLVIVGLMDMAYMGYCLYVGEGYSSCLNIFAVIGGAFLWRGHLGATRLVTRFTAFCLAASIGALLFLVPQVLPIDLWLTQFKLNPLMSFSEILLPIAMVGFFAWTYLQLRSAPVLDALQSHGYSVAPPRVAMGLGIAMMLAMTIILRLTLGGATGAKAMALAKAEYGGQYKYAPAGLSWVNDHVTAKLTAYNDHEIKTVTVEWPN